MFEGYMDLAGQEIVNNARVAAYAANAGLLLECDECDNLPNAVDDLPYVTPADFNNEAPWYDAAVPQSGQFLGVMGMSVAGLDTNPISRTPAALVADGSSVGVLRRTHRELAYTVMLVAQNEPALTYGLEWLAAALRGGACTSATCWGDTLCMFSACPGDTLGSDLHGDSELRHLYDVGLLEGPTVSGRQYLASGMVLATVTFVLVAGKPWVYREPLITSPDWVLMAGGERRNNWDPDSVYAQCVQPTPCLDDPLWCPPPPLPPLPPVPVSPCYPKGRANFVRSVVSLSVLDVPQWLETVPVLEVSTGSRAMRRLIVRFWANPQGLDCGSVTEPCSACLDISVAFLPAGSTLTVDGRLQRATVDCPSGLLGSAQSTPVVYGRQGETFEWPVFSCPTGLCVEIISGYESTAADARARVTLIPRADVG